MKNIKKFLIITIIGFLFIPGIIGVYGYYPVIGDFVWADSNANGIQDVGETGIADVTVNLYSHYGSFIDTVNTDASGYYSFYASPYRAYFVEFVLPVGYVFSPQDQGSDDTVDSDADTSTGQTIITEITGGEVDMTWDCGMYQPQAECEECDGKITQLTLQYNGPDTALIKVKQGKRDIIFEDNVMPYYDFTFNGTKKDGTMGNEIKIYVNGILDTKIHTSCSRPIGPGMVFGSFEIIAGYSLLGGLLCPYDPGDIGYCEYGVKPSALTMLYTGEDCSASSHHQDPKKVKCNGDPAFTDPVHIIATDKKNPDDPKAKIWFDGIADLNAEFVINATNAGQTKLKASTHVLIYNATDDTLLQTIEFHTSCSQPLFEGDQFGSLKLTGFVAEE